MGGILIKPDPTGPTHPELNFLTRDPVHPVLLARPREAVIRILRLGLERRWNNTQHQPGEAVIRILRLDLERRWNNTQGQKSVWWSLWNFPKIPKTIGGKHFFESIERFTPGFEEGVVLSLWSGAVVAPSVISCAGGGLSLPSRPKRGFCRPRRENATIYELFAFPDGISGTERVALPQSRFINTKLGQQFYCVLYVFAEGVALSYGGDKQQNQMKQPETVGHGSTPPSGIDLISGDEQSNMLASTSNNKAGDKEKLIEAAKLLSIQKAVGFSFEEAEDVTIRQLIDQERGDRAKKMEEEKKEDDCDWVFLPSEGRSGGILSIWGKSNNSLIFSFMGEGFVGVCLEWGVRKTICLVINVYSKCDVASKRRLWSNLIDCKRGLGDERWCVVGDFNAVGRLEERIGVNSADVVSTPTEVVEFRNFMEDLELVDIPLLGRRFTWYQANGRAARIGELVVDIRDLDVRGELVGLSTQELEGRKEKFGILWKLLKSKEMLLFQRSRSKWLKEGDANTKFFHGSVKARLKSNLVMGLLVDGEWLESPSLIKAAVSSFLKNHVSSIPKVRPKLDGVVFPSLSEEETVGLTSPFTLEEIEDVVQSSDGNKSPGPDGFNYAFLKKFWELIKGEIRILFDQFHGNSSLSKCFLSYFVTLIPKVSSPGSLSDFRPISLLGCLYKLIAKVLAKRLAKVMDSVIAPNQSAFIKGRNLVDGVVIVNEVVEAARNSKKECVIFKVDFEKAYARLIGVSLITCSGVDGFSGVMRRTVDLNLFKGFSLGRNPIAISHLQYAYDTLCIGEVSVENLWTIKAILRGFELASGLKVNFWKSGLIGVNVSPTFMTMACTFLNCRLGTFPFKYLGLPIGANPKCLTTWDPLLAHLRKRLCSWRNKHISLGGRIVMINAVLNAIPIFHLSFLKMPVLVWKKVVRIQREFLWGCVRGGKKVSWVKWSVVCKDKAKGGLGVRDIRLVNISLLSKWRWRLLQPGRPLWKEVLVAKYGEFILNKVDWSGVRIPSTASMWWRDISSIDKVVSSKDWFAESIVRKVGNGNSTSFWSTIWIGDDPLSVVFPRLFSLSNNNDRMVKDFGEYREGRWIWSFSWRRDLFQWEEDLVAQLRELLDPVVLSLEEDWWRWRPETNGVFSVNSSYKLLVDELESEEVLEEAEITVFGQIWDSPAPSKVIAFSWQLLYDQIPTRKNLEARDMVLADMPWECVGCVGNVESSLHLFLHCPSAMLVWYEVFKWLGLVIVIPPSLFLLFEIFRGSARNVKIRKGLMMIWHATLWSIWKARNRSMFGDGVFIPMDIVEDTKVLS
ncbi:hypothetical protein TSUD_360410 [Trifolium subterraneum]|uniref:Reverse transcriptase domain-containing protein n=1 Tax=Trifolium subterraneum TaxID=3900 RepID=A0A2Z6MAF6_TRISU|nr:hypothetical protein TSUD_360410 [Trifolium subterraneum]